MLAFAVSAQRLKPVSWDGAEIIETTGGMLHIELALRLADDAAEPLHEGSHPQPFGGAIAKRSDHATGTYCMRRYTSSV